MNPIELAAGVSLITPDRLANLLAAYRETEGVPGDAAELGVYRGGSARALSATRPHTRIHLFDTFTGLPESESVELDPDGHCPKGRFASSESEAREFLKDCDVVFNVGVFPIPAILYSDARFCFVHVDCDLYAGARDAIEFFWPRLSVGGIMFFDDYGCEFTGVTKAVDEAFPGPAIDKQFDCHGFQIGAAVRKLL